jgi:hypothetical protein
MRTEDYDRRAAECRAFAQTSRDEDERAQMLIMANTLQQLALRRKNTKRGATVRRHPAQRAGETAKIW